MARRAWLTEAEFADIVSLCQFPPGPASSQTGFLIGMMRGGWRGALLAWVGFTLPSACLMVAFAYGARGLMGSPLLHGLNLVAVAIVTQAVWRMAGSLCPDRVRKTLAGAAAIMALTLPANGTQGLIILAGALAGLVFCRAQASVAPESSPDMPQAGRTAASICLSIFVALLVLPGFFSGGHAAIAIFGAFYRTGALVFGGGHVVLPWLRDAVVTPGLVPETTFLSGYGAAQAVPGPLFRPEARTGQGKTGSGSFLKKRTKKLLPFWFAFFPSGYANARRYLLPLAKKKRILS